MRVWMLGFLCGVIPVAWLPQLPGHGFGLLAGLVGIWASRLPGVLRSVGGAALGVSLAVVFGHGLLERRISPDCVGTPLRFTGTVASLPVSRQIDGATRRQRFEFDLRSMQPVHCAGPRRLSLSYFGDAEILPGQSWRFAATLKQPWGLSNPGLANGQAWFAQAGIDAVGAVRRGYLLEPAPGPLTVHHRLRHRIARFVDDLPLREDVAAVLKALSVADRSGIDGPLWQLFQTYGVNHLLVISGLHIGMVAGLGYLLGGAVHGVAARLLQHRGSGAPWQAACACVLAVAYAALAGFSLPTQRALCMTLVLMLALVLGRPGNAGNALLLAAVLVLALNPLAALGAGFWLSFGTVALLLWLGAWRGGGRALRSALRVHIIMALLMLPLGAWFFGGSSLVAAPANALLIPLVGVLIVPLVLLAAITTLCGADALAAWLWQLLALPLGGLLDAASAFAAGHSAWIYRELHASGAEMSLGIAAVALLVLPLARRWRLALGLLLVPLLLPGQGGSNAGQAAPERTLIVTVLDVGQGTAVVLRSGNRALLYDTGGGDPNGSTLASRVVVPYLQRMGIRALDTLVISHGDLDHSAGAPHVVARFPVGRLRYGDGLPDLAGGSFCRAGEAWRWPGNIRFQFLAPPPTRPALRNDRSCVLAVRVGDTRLLLPGDIGTQVERELVRYWGDGLASDWLLAPHHGSRSSSSWPLLKQVDPEYAVVSSGYANRFGHPHQVVVARYLSLEVGLSNTASDGALGFTVRAGSVKPEASNREKYHHYWM